MRLSEAIKAYIVRRQSRRFDILSRSWGMAGGGATRPLPRDGGMEEPPGDPIRATPQPEVKNVMVRFPPLYPRGGPKWRNNYPEGPDHPVAPNRLGHVSTGGSLRSFFTFSSLGRSLVAPPGGKLLF